MGTVHEFKPKPKNTGQFTGPAPFAKSGGPVAPVRKKGKFRPLLRGLVTWAALIGIAAAAAAIW